MNRKEKKKDYRACNAPSNNNEIVSVDAAASSRQCQVNPIDANIGVVVARCMDMVLKVFRAEIYARNITILSHGFEQANCNPKKSFGFHF